MQRTYDQIKAGKKIQLWQREMGLRGYEIAKKVGITPSYYTNIRRGKLRGSVDVLSDICTLLGHELSELTEVPSKKKGPQISKTAIARALRPVLGTDAKDAADCVVLWLRSPEGLRKALTTFARSV